MRLVALFGVLAVTPALAEVSPSQVTNPVDERQQLKDWRRTYLELNLGTHFGKSFAGYDSVTLSPMVRIAQPVGENEVLLDWGMASHSLTDYVPFDQTNGAGADQSTFRLGNPYMAFLFGWRIPERRIRAGIGLAAPAARLRTEEVVESEVDNSAFFAMAGIHGGRDAWLWAPETLSVVGHFDIDFRWANGLVVGGALKAAELVGVDRRDGELDTFVQLDLLVGWEHPVVRPGLLVAYGNVVTSDAERDQADFISATPEVRFRIPKAVDLVLGLTFNVDKPYGVSFADDGSNWGLSFAVSSPTEPQLPRPEKKAWKRSQ